MNRSRRDKLKARESEMGAAEEMEFILKQQETILRTIPAKGSHSFERPTSFFNFLNLFWNSDPLKKLTIGRLAVVVAQVVERQHSVLAGRV